ncbi:MAG: M56 family metallopeptidase [Candidatus Aminicenantaceae bacterium]
MEFSLGVKFLNLICEFIIKSSLVLAASLLLAFLFRKKSATIRHFLLSFSIISLLLFPFLSSITTGWETRWLPSWQAVKNSSSTFNEREKNKDPLINLNQKDKTSQENGGQPDGIEKTKDQNKKTVFLKTIEVKKLLGLSLITIWTAGLIFLLIRIFSGLYGAHRLTRQGKRISGSLWHLLLQRFLNTISIKRKVSLFSHAQVKAPLTWGVIKPVVIMPAEAGNWTKNQCSSALFHELSHIKRYDFLIKILARFICSLYWFNPLSWLVFRSMKNEQEKACDELVLKAGVKPSTYAADLLSIKKAGQIQWNPPAAVLGAVGKSQFNERVLTILKKQLKPKEVKMKTKILLSFFIIALITFIGLVRPSQSAASNETIFSDNDTLLTEIQNPPPTENAQEKQEKKKSEKAEKKESTDKKDKKKEKEFKVLKLDRDNVFSIKVGKGKLGKKFILLGIPELHCKVADAAKKCYTIQIKGKKKKLHITTPVFAHAFPHLDLHPSVPLKTEHKKLREKLTKLREKLIKIRELKDIAEIDKAQEEALKDIEEVLKDLSEELEEKPEKLKDLKLGIKIETDLKYKLAHKIKHLEKIDCDLKSIEIKGDKKIICVLDEDEGFQLIIKSKLDSENKGKYEEILKKLKEGLPEGYKAESEIDEENNKIIIKITTGKKDEKSKKEIKKLLEEIADELSKLEEKTS